MNNDRSCIWREGAVDTSDRQLTKPDVIKSVCKHKYYWREEEVKQCRLCGEILYNQTVL